MGSIVNLSDKKLAANYRAPRMSVYNAQLQKQWLNRWKFLLIDQQFSIQEVADQYAVLQILL